MTRSHSLPVTKIALAFCGILTMSDVARADKVSIASLTPATVWQLLHREAPAATVTGELSLPAFPPVAQGNVRLSEQLRGRTRNRMNRYGGVRRIHHCRAAALLG